MGEPSTQSEVLSSLEQVSSRISLYFVPFRFYSILTSLPVPATEKHPHSMMLPPACFTEGMAQFWFHQTRESCFSWSESPLAALWQTSSRLSTEEWLPSGHSTIKTWLVECCRDGCTFGRFSHLHRVALLEWPSGSWSRPWPKPFSPDCSVWPGGQL